MNITLTGTGKPDNLCGLLYCGGLEPNLQHLPALPVFNIHSFSLCLFIHSFMQFVLIECLVYTVQGAGVKAVNKSHG